MKRILLVFFTALGVVLGGSITGALAATIVGDSPLKIMFELSQELKLWAVITALGGTFTTLRVIEGGVFEGKINLLIKQFILLTAAFLGAQLGLWLISILTGGD